MYRCRTRDEKGSFWTCTETQKAELDKRRTRKAAVEKPETKPTKAPLFQRPDPRSLFDPLPPCFLKSRQPYGKTNLRVVEADFLVVDKSLEFEFAHDGRLSDDPASQDDPLLGREGEHDGLGVEEDD